RRPQGDRRMTRRKREISRPEIKRKWPYHVALSADKVRGLRNSELVRSLAKELSGAPRPYAVHRDGGDLAVFCFAKPEDAPSVRRAFRRGALAGRRPQMTGPPLSAKELHALTTLVNEGRNGAEQPLLTAQGFNVRLMARLMSMGLAALMHERVRAGRGTIEVAKVRITNAG